MLGADFNFSPEKRMSQGARARRVSGVEQWDREADVIVVGLGAAGACAAIEAAESSELLREAFGADVLEHYLHFARTEKRKFDEAVTTWERQRFLERS